MGKGSREGKQKSGGPGEGLSVIADLLVAEIYDSRCKERGEGRILEGLEGGQ